MEQPSLAKDEHMAKNIRNMFETGEKPKLQHQLDTDETVSLNFSLAMW